ncbi:MAG: STAS domain-containing protein [Myxococcota bacterium]
MEFERVTDGSFSIVRVPSRVDVTNTQELLSAVRSCTAQGSDQVILDLSATEAIDSTALGAIVSLYKSLRVGEGDLKLASVQEGVKRVLALTRLDRVFDAYDDVAAAKGATQAAS